MLGASMSIIIEKIKSNRECVALGIWKLRGNNYTVGEKRQSPWRTAECAQSRPPWDSHQVTAKFSTALTGSWLLEMGKHRAPSSRLASQFSAKKSNYNGMGISRKRLGLRSKWRNWASMTCFLSQNCTSGRAGLKHDSSTFKWQTWCFPHYATSPLRGNWDPRRQKK